MTRTSISIYWTLTRKSIKCAVTLSLNILSLVLSLTHTLERLVTALLLMRELRRPELK